MITKSFTKINLSLSILGFDDNANKHKIESIFLLHKKLYDIIFLKDITKNKNKKTKINYFYLKKFSKIKFNNCLINKTIEWLNNKFNKNDKYIINVLKIIPIESGLGGASSNAATIINFFINKYNIKLDKDDYYDIAKNLGSDICFFLTKYNCAFISNIGDKIRYLNRPDIKYILKTNNYQSNTKEIFELYKKSTDKKYKYNLFHNDLEPYCILKNPHINLLLNKYRKKYKKCLISGSGSSIVCIKEINLKDEIC